MTYGRAISGRGGRLGERSHLSLRWVFWITVGLVLAMCWDRAAWLHFAVRDEARLDALAGKDWFMTLRVAGSLYAWIVVAAILAAIDFGRPGAWRRPAFVLGAAALGGAVAELIKPLSGRLRPELTDGGYMLAPLAERLEMWGDIGFVSSHAAVAAGGATAIGLMCRRAWPVMALVAAGCALTRVRVGAHFLSDAYGGLVVGYAVAQALWALDRRPRGSKPASGTAANT